MVGKAFAFDSAFDIIAGPLLQALAATLAITALALALGVFPGHSDAGLWPIYVPEHYGTRNSQHLLDPYRLGIRIFIVLSFLAVQVVFQHFKMSMFPIFDSVLIQAQNTLSWVLFYVLPKLNNFQSSVCYPFNNYKKCSLSVSSTSIMASSHSTFSRSWHFSLGRKGAKTNPDFFHFPLPVWPRLSSLLSSWNSLRIRISSSIGSGKTLVSVLSAQYMMQSLHFYTIEIGSQI